MIAGWNIGTFTVAAAKLQLMLDLLAEGTNTICAELHIRDLPTVKKLAEVIQSNRFSCYCWCQFNDKAQLEQPEYQNLRNARFVFGAVTVSVEEKQDLPPYDWNEQPPTDAFVRLSIIHDEPWTAENAEPSQEIIVLCSKLAETVKGCKLDESVSTVTVFREDCRRHDYIMPVTKHHVPLLIRLLVEALKLGRGLSSLEFLGSSADIEAIEQLDLYHFSEFPVDCWSLNASAKTPFALARHSFLCPVPNLLLTSLPDASAAIASVQNGLESCTLVKKYLGWRLDDLEIAPHLQGNYIMTSAESVGYSISVGFDQHALSDPPLSRYRAMVGRRIETLGVKLKKGLRK